jgi:hypothetical protein
MVILADALNLVINATRSQAQTLLSYGREGNLGDGISPELAGSISRRYPRYRIAQEALAKTKRGRGDTRRKLKIGRVGPPGVRCHSGSRVVAVRLPATAHS